jgi:hypothetical protein
LRQKVTLTRDRPDSTKALGTEASRSIEVLLSGFDGSLVRVLCDALSALFSGD